jgi:hypothetical protein
LTLLENIAQLPKSLAQGPIGRLSSQGLIEKSIASKQTAHAQVACCIAAFGVGCMSDLKSLHLKNSVGVLH